MTSVSSVTYNHLFMAKTPFNRQNSSVEEKEINENSDENGFQEEEKIQINKKGVPQANAMPVVNKMSQSVYADHQNQANHPPKGNLFFLTVCSTFH